MRCNCLAPCIVKLNSKRHLSVKRNSRSYSYVVVFPTKKGQTLQIEEAAPSPGGKNVLNERSSTGALTKKSIVLSDTIKDLAGKNDHIEKLLWLRTAAAQRARKSQSQSHCSL